MINDGGDDDDDEEDDDDGFGGEYLPLVALAGARDGPGRNANHPGPRGARYCGVPESSKPVDWVGQDEWGPASSLVWTLDHRHHVARLDSTPCSAARGWIAPADVPLDRRQVRLPPKKKKKKMTQGWVVYGGMRHAEPQREMFSRSYPRRNFL
jgi:hypothetical protein